MASKKLLQENVDFWNQGKEDGEEGRKKKFDGIKRVRNAYLFPNGMLAVFDEKGRQILELQGVYSVEKHRLIIEQALLTCEFHGLDKHLN